MARGDHGVRGGPARGDRREGACARWRRSPLPPRRGRHRPLRNWPQAVRDAGFDPRTPTVWLIEGLLQYLDETAVGTLFARIDALSAPASVLLYDVVGKTLLEAPFMAGLRQSMAEQGSPWLFATDTPGAPAEAHGWSAAVTDVAEPGHRWGRWQAPVVPADVPDAPRGYFVEAVKTPISEIKKMSSGQL